MSERTVKVDSNTLSRIEELKRKLNLKSNAEVIRIAIELLRCVLECVPPKYLSRQSGTVFYRELLQNFNIICTLRELAEFLCTCGIRGPDIERFTSQSLMYYEVKDEKERCVLGIFDVLFKYSKDRRDLARKLTTLLLEMEIPDYLAAQIENLLERLGLKLERVEGTLVVTLR